MSVVKSAIAVVLLILGVHLSIETTGVWALVGGGCLGYFASMAVGR
jgi:hypothetical protein